MNTHAYTHIHTQNCDAEIQFNSLHVLLLSQPSHPMLTMSTTVSKAGLSLAKRTNNQLAGKRELPLRKSDPIFSMQWTVCLDKDFVSLQQLKLILFMPKGKYKEGEYFLLIRWFTHSTSISQYMYPLHGRPWVKAGCAVVSRNGHSPRCHRA